jgi:hypothetical protein
MQFDRNGVMVRQSQPIRRLKTVKKLITIDSRDRDPTKYVKVNGGASISDPGDYVVYLPRVYENVVSLRLMSANIEAPAIIPPAATGGFTDNYILLELEGLNRSDETATGANRAGFVDSWFAKINNPNITSGTTNNTYTIFYNDLVDQPNIVKFTPPIGRLDRFHVTFRYHPATVGTTPTTSSNNAPIIFGAGQDNTLTFEIEYLDNVFEDFSSFETHLDARATENNIYTVGRGY